MDGELKKYYHKYKYLSLEIEDLQEEIKVLQNKWYEKYRHKLNNSPRYVEEEETTDFKTNEFKTQNKNLKPLYKKLSKKLHPDTGGDTEKFVKFKEEYERGNFFGLTELAIENNIEIDKTQIGLEEYQNQIKTLESQLKELYNNTFYWFYKGNNEQQQMAKYYLESFYNTKIFEKEKRII